MKSETENPWCVSTIEDFLQYVCPDCNVTKKDKEEFVRHALSEHPNSANYLGQLIIKEELFEDIDDANENDYEGLDYSNNDSPGSYSYIPEPEVNLTSHPNGIVKKSNADEQHQSEDDENLFKNSISPVVHEGKKKFICNICGNLFTVRQSVKQHIICVHQGRKDYVCPHCKKAVSSIKSLRDHIAAVVRKLLIFF